MNYLVIGNKYPGVFGVEHIIYLVVVIVLFALGLFLITKYVKTEKSRTMIVKISGLVLLILILINRISVTYTNVVVNHREGYTWLNLIPNTFCGMSSLVLSLAVLFGKKDNNVLHFIAYLGFFGGFVTMIYPDFLDSQTFFDIRSITGLLHHTMMVWVTIILIKTKYLIPSLKKWKAFPIGLTIMMTVGIFEIDCLGFDKAMQIKEPLISSLPVFTSWYVVGLLLLLLQYLFLYTFEKVKVNTKK